MGAMESGRLVIVGGGFAGLYAARELAGRDVRVTVVDRRNHHLFQPLLYQVATAGLSPGDIAYPIRRVMAQAPNVSVLLAEAVKVDPQGRRLILADGELPYDALLLAAGARHSYFGHPDWERHAPGLKSVEDALEMRRRILLAFESAERESDETRRRALLTFAVIGGGPTGVELAGALHEIAAHALAREFRAIDPARARIVLLESGPRLLPAFDESLGRAAERTLAERNVEVRTGTVVTGVSEGRIETSAGPIEARTVLWAAGIEASPLARSLGAPLDRAGRVLVEADLSVPGRPEIFVAGDLAAFLHQRGSEGRALPAMAPVAIQMGRRAAENVMLRLRGEPTVPFRFRDKGVMAAIGRNAAVAQIGPLKVKGFAAWLLWALVHIFYLIGFRHRFLVMTEWAWAYATYGRGVRLITGPTGAARRSD